MKNVIRKFYMVLTTAVWVSFPATAPLAEDTEIYVGGNLGASLVRPNVLFIIDTSGSMGSSVTLTNGTYDPSVTYTGTCDPTRVYWSHYGNPPTCSTSHYVAVSSNKCNDSSTPLSAGGTGFYVGRMARYRNRSSDYWTYMNHWDHTSIIECEADYAVHGDGVDATKLYPANESNGGPWRADATSTISWSGTSRSYTFYSANYLNWVWSPGVVTTTTRIQIVKDTFDSLLNSTSGINAGLMRFSQNGEGGYFTQPMMELDATSRPILIADVNAMTASGVTPLSETSYESSLYWRSASVDYGDSSTPATNVASVLDPSDASKYKTPMEYQCQKNFVVMLTDGAPVSDTGANTKISSLNGFNTITGSSSCSGNCLDEMAQWLYETDLDSTLNDKQNVTTYTIGFLTDQVLLSDTARKGGGEYYTAESATELSTAFTSILTDILSVNTTFIAPAVTVNAFNRLTNRDDLYFAVFRPAGSPNWAGNLKHYKLGTAGGITNIVVDANAAAAVDANTGFFSSTSRSFWTLNADAPDGEIVDIGGAAGLLSTSRTLYTYTDSAAPINVDLTLGAHSFIETNTAITKTMLGDATMTDTYRTSLLQWARGVDVLDNDEDGSVIDARRAMGDALHSKPVLVTYGGTDASPDITLFTANNEGFIHAINTTTGVEDFAFIPQELLGNLDIRYKNSSGQAHPYGMDGALSVWHNDLNNNGVVFDEYNVLETGESVYLYAGMRRGGNYYYALNVTDRANPKLLWKITGGTGDFAELGETWSRPMVTKIKLFDGTSLVDRTVLIFAGGYDTAQDSVSVPASDAVGRAIYIVDAATGQRIWWASSDATANLVLTDMTNSIPSDVRVIDINADGFADRLYVGDMGGRVFRIDFDNATNTGVANFATGGLLASLGGVDEANNRRFYYPPDVALIYDKKTTTPGFKLTVSIGSGYRAHPLNMVNEDRFYMIKDSDVYAPPTDGGDADTLPDYPAYTEASLYDATANILGEGTGTTLASATSSFQSLSGWYIKLEKSDGTYEGEKVLASSVTVGGKILFTTFTPVAAAAATACAPSQGTAKTYIVNLTDAAPVLDLVADDTLNKADRAVLLTRGGIPPAPTILFPPDGSDAIVLVGPEKLEGFDVNLSYVKSFWRQDE